MVFSNTSLKTHNILKVLEIDYLKAGKSQNQQVDELPAEVSLETRDCTAPPSPLPGTSLTEDILKTEPVFESTMYHELDSEFFQDLGSWCYTPEKEDQIQTIDTKKITAERAYNTATPYTQFSPQGWDGFNANSPLASTGLYTSTPKEPLSPNMEESLNNNSKFTFSNLDVYNNQEQFLDISSLPVVIGDLASEDITDTNQLSSATEHTSWANLHTKSNIDTNNIMPFIDQEDSLGYDTKCITWSEEKVLKDQINTNDVVISEFIINDQNIALPTNSIKTVIGNHIPHNLKLDVSARPSYLYGDPVINTPDVLRYVEQLEKEKFEHVIQTDEKQTEDCVQDNASLISTNISNSLCTSNVDYKSITPKTESHIESDCEDIRSNSSIKRRRHNSEDSDETYTPYSEKPSPRKYKRRKPSVPIKDMILALEGTQQQNKARRGRPPKRRESVVSSVCSIEETASTSSTYDGKYRELRDKNNEASKRSRMNRKLKELQMEQQADELEQRNEQLKVRADILEDMTKRLKDALMTAILNK